MKVPLWMFYEPEAIGVTTRITVILATSSTNCCNNSEQQWNRELDSSQVLWHIAKPSATALLFVCTVPRGDWKPQYLSVLQESIGKGESLSKGASNPSKINGFTYLKNILKWESKNYSQACHLDKYENGLLCSFSHTVL